MHIPELMIDTYDEQTGILILSLNRRDKLNAFNDEMLENMQEHIDRVEKSELVKGLIIKSELNNAFCTGVDVAYVRELANEAAATFFTKAAEVLERITNLTIPTIAMINGYTFGMGADLALACDFRIAGEQTKMRFPGPQFGLVLGTHRLVNEVGPSIARKLAFTNELLHVHQSLEYGLVHYKCENNKLLEKAYDVFESVKNIPKQTFTAIQKICNENSDFERGSMTPVASTRRSVLEGNFNERFSQYVEGVKRSK